MAKKVTTEIAEVAEPFDNVLKLIKQVTELDFDEDYPNLSVGINAQGYKLDDDNWNLRKTYKTLAEVETRLQEKIAELSNLARARVKALTGKNGYDAIINENGIKVGCNNVSFEKFEELATKVADVKEEMLVKAAASKAEREAKKAARAAARAAKPVVKKVTRSKPRVGRYY